MIWAAYRLDPEQVVRLCDDPSIVTEFLEDEDDERSIDLDKSWHGIHWLLTGSEGPTAATLSEAIFGGVAAGEDLGYGPPRLLAASEVGGVAAALGRVDVQQLRSRMDRAAMDAADIYPQIWDEEDVFETYLGPNYEALRDFYADAAAAGDAILQVIC